MHKHPSSSDTQLLPPSQPFLRWAGGKKRLLQQLLPFLPPGQRLIEPFLGAGSVFLGTHYPSAVLNDANPDLVAVWVALRERPAAFIAAARQLFVESNRTAEAYEAIRADYNACLDRFERAVRFIYLNRFGFNGIYRVNRRGVYNVPFGRPASLPGFPLESMERASNKLASCLILNGGFAAALEGAGTGDVVYCDPPYSSSKSGASFSGYTPEGFPTSSHEALVRAAVGAVGRGATVLISNHDTCETRELYRGWHIEGLTVRRSVSGDDQARGFTGELVAILPART